MRTFEVDGPLRLSVDCPTGDVRVATTDGPRAEVDVVALRDDEATREAVAQTVVDLRDGELFVEVPRRHGSLFQRDPKIRIDARVPHGSALTFATASADVVASGRYGEIRGRTASGDVRVTDADEVRIETASGDLRIESVRGAASLKAASGDISIRNAGGRVEASVVSGDLRVRSAANGATLAAVSGDIEVETVAQGAVEVRSVSGDVTLGVPRGTRVHVDVSTVSGDLRSDVELTDAPGDGDGPLVDIHGRTVSGDLRVRRAG